MKFEGVRHSHAEGNGVVTFNVISLLSEWLECVVLIDLMSWNYSSPLLAPEIKQGYPLNLSISVSGGKETNKDSLSSGE
jgi:hypothetical protein